MRTLRTDSKLVLYRELRKDKNLNLWVWYCTVRSVHITKSIDGYSLRNFEGFSRSTNSKNIAKAIKLGWLSLAKNKYYFKGIHKIAKEYGVTTRHLRSFRGKDMTEINARVACNYLAYNVKSQNIKEGCYRREDKVQYKSKHYRYLNENIIFSTRSLCRLMGLNSTSHATKIFREGVRLGLIKRKRLCQYLGDVDKLKNTFDLNRCFVVCGQVYERKTSCLCIA